MRVSERLAHVWPGLSEPRMVDRFRSKPTRVLHLAIRELLGESCVQRRAHATKQKRFVAKNAFSRSRTKRNPRSANHLRPTAVGAQRQNPKFPERQHPFVVLLTKAPDNTPPRSSDVGNCSTTSRAQKKDPVGPARVPTGSFIVGESRWGGTHGRVVATRRHLEAGSPPCASFGSPW